MTESDLIRDILVTCSRGDVRLFRRNAGIAWQGTIIEQTEHILVLRQPHAVRLGIPGMSDLDGWSDVELRNAAPSGRVVFSRYVM